MKQLVWVVLAACSSVTGVKGSGAAKSEVRPIAGAFDAIDIGGAFDAEITVGSEPRVELSGDDNLLPLITTELDGHTLRIGSKQNLRPSLKLIARITAPQLTAVDVSGSADVKVHGARGDRLALHISGSGDLRGDGAVHELAVEVSGSGDLELASLTAERAHVRISGSGEADVAVSQNLDVDISGSGTVRYHGDPAIKKSISGAGDLVKQ